jgi:4-hydroxy-tetrahydrodipicolinate synthase
MLKGSIVALVTPFKDGKVDVEKIKELVEFHIQNGTSAILACGTTGESPTLDYEEHNLVIDTCIEASNGRVPVMAGTGSNSTAEAITITHHASTAGADCALIVTPYYNKPTQEGLYRHFKEIADSVDIPILLYNVPGRTSKNIETETVVRLANDCKNIIGVKEASGSINQMQDVIKQCPDDFILFSGDDALTLPVLGIGGVGVISVVANFMPQETARLIQLFNDNNVAEARALHYKMLPVIRAMFLEANPCPVKKAMELLGLCSGSLRLPLCEITEDTTEKVTKALKDYGLLSG